MRLLLSGYYGFGNLGDEALLAGLAGSLAKAGHGVTVLSGNPASTVAEHGLPAVHRLYGLPAALLRSQAVISGGGGLLQDATSSRSLDYYLGVIGLAKRLGRRVAVYGQSLGPLSSAGRSKVARSLAGLPIWLRDEPSLRLAGELGLAASPTADPALLLEAPKAVGRATAAPVLLIPRGGHPAHNRPLANLAAQLTAAGEECAAVAMHPREDANEVENLRRAAPGLAVLSPAGPAELMAVMVRSRFVVSVRLHGCVLAAACNVGFVAIAYDSKVRGFAAQVGAPVFDEAASVDVLLGLVEAARPADAGLVGRARDLAASGIAEMAAHLAA